MADSPARISVTFKTHAVCTLLVGFDGTVVDRHCCVDESCAGGEGFDVKRRRRPQTSPVELSAFAGFRFPPDVILLGVRWYLRYGLSYSDVEELLAERGIDVDHVTIHRWVQRFTPLLIDAARPCRHAVGSRWFVDETYVKVAGKWRYIYRAVDQHGQVIDVYVSRRRDLAAARRFFTAVLVAHGEPDEVVTDLAQTLESVIEELIPAAFHNTENVRPIAPDDPAFTELFRRRNDAESINRNLEDTRWLNRAHSLGQHRQHLNLIGYALMVNALATARHKPPQTLAA